MCMPVQCTPEGGVELSQEGLGTVRTIAALLEVRPQAASQKPVGSAIPALADWLPGCWLSQFPDALMRHPVPPAATRCFSGIPPLSSSSSCSRSSWRSLAGAGPAAGHSGLTRWRQPRLRCGGSRGAGHRQHEGAIHRGGDCGDGTRLRARGSGRLHAGGWVATQCHTATTPVLVLQLSAVPPCVNACGWWRAAPWPVAVLLECSSRR